ncbi:Uncharacterized protein FKW44_020607, partial [Caligus rogercresseyi]
VASPHDRRLSMDPKSVMFSDGVRPGGDLAADLEGSPDTHHHRYPSHRSGRVGVVDALGCRTLDEACCRMRVCPLSRVWDPRIPWNWRLHSNEGPPLPFLSI